MLKGSYRSEYIEFVTKKKTMLLFSSFRLEIFLQIRFFVSPLIISL